MEVKTVEEKQKISEMQVESVRPATRENCTCSCSKDKVIRETSHLEGEIVSIRMNMERNHQRRDRNHGSISS